MFSAISSRSGPGSLYPFLVLAFSLGLPGSAMAETFADIRYAERSTGALALDIHMPDGIDTPPLVVWVHGGAWQFSDKNDPLSLPIVSQGFALASLDFRQATEAAFPAQLHDINEALRFLRANASQYGYSAESMAIWGHSSGGHLAALVGTTQNGDWLNGDDSAYPEVDPSVQAIVVMAGPSNLTTILHQSTPRGLRVREPALELLLGGSLEEDEVVVRARQASPVFQIDPADPPLLLIHGMQDSQVPVNQALELEAAYQSQGLQVESLWLPEADHASPDYFSGPYFDRVVTFLRRHLE